MAAYTTPFGVPVVVEVLTKTATCLAASRFVGSAVALSFSALTPIIRQRSKRTNLSPVRDACAVASLEVLQMKNMRREPL